MADRNRSSRKTRARPRAPITKLSAHHRGGATESMEDYLECISDILGSQGFVRVADVAERLDVARASVSVMVRRLAKLGYLDYIKYRGFRLTPAGEKLAARIRSRHATLQEFFSLLGLAPAALEKDVEGIEHHISDQTLIVLQRFNQFFRQRPELLEELH